MAKAEETNAVDTIDRSLASMAAELRTMRDDQRRRDHCAAMDSLLDRRLEAAVLASLEP